MSETQSMSNFTLTLYAIPLAILLNFSFDLVGYLSELLIYGIKKKKGN